MRREESNPCKCAFIGRLKSNIALFLTGGMTCQNGVLSHIWVVPQHWWTCLKVPKLTKNTDLNTPEIPLTHLMPDVSSHLCGKVTLVEVGYLIATLQSATFKLHDIFYKIV